MTNFQIFTSLHHQKRAFILPNAWDAKSAQIIENSGYPAIATSSAAIANSWGYEDGENISFNEYFYIINRILKSVKIPVSVDIEMGYADSSEQLIENVLRLYEIGVVGVNIEDSVICNSERSLGDANQFAEKLKELKLQLDSENREMFINVRCDSYLLGVEDPLNTTIKRATLYEAAGADALFIPLLVDIEQIQTITSQIALPLNVLTVNGLSDFETLNQAGVKRISLGNFLFEKIYNNIGSVLNQIEDDMHCSILFEE